METLLADQATEEGRGAEGSAEQMGSKRSILIPFTFLIDIYIQQKRLMVSQYSNMYKCSFARVALHFR